jgi:TrmH family RNA methyltransferase
VPTELSPRNPRVERVRDLRTSRGRRETASFAAEGPTLLEEAERSGVRPRELYVTAAGAEKIPLARYEGQGVPAYLVPDRVFARLTDVETPTGVLAVFPLAQRSAAEVLARDGMVLLLAGVADPGNAGTLVRSAEAFGAAGVLFGRGGVDPYGPKVVRSAMGSLFRVPVATVDAETLLEVAQASLRPIVASDLAGEDVTTAPIPPRAILAVGNERHGVREWLPRWDRAVRIPQRGLAESLNAAVAGSILLYESSRCQVPCQVAEKP